MHAIVNEVVSRPHVTADPIGSPPRPGHAAPTGAHHPWAVGTQYLAGADEAHEMYPRRAISNRWASDVVALRL